MNREGAEPARAAVDFRDTKVVGVPSMCTLEEGAVESVVDAIVALELIIGSSPERTKMVVECLDGGGVDPSLRVV